jgi:hypothetical protein
MPPSSPPAYEITNSSANISNIDTTGANSSSNTSHSFVTASAGGSILGEYEASPFQRLPRGFESIASMPPLPSLPSTASLKGPTSMASHSALIPRGGSTWTLAASVTTSQQHGVHAPYDTRPPPPRARAHGCCYSTQESTTSLLDGGRACFSHRFPPCTRQSARLTAHRHLRPSQRSCHSHPRPTRRLPRHVGPSR